MRKVLVRFMSLALLIVFVLAALPTGNAVDENEKNAAPELVKGSKWSQSAEVDFSGFFDTIDIDGLVDEMVGELKSEGILDSLDVDFDINGGLGMFMTTEVVDVGIETNGEQCNHIRTSTYFGSGLGVDLDAGFSGNGISADGSGSAGYYIEFDLIVDTWVTVDELALVKADMTLKPEFKAEVDAEANGKAMNMEFDIDVNGYVKTKDVVAKLTLDFDEPFDYLDLPIEENEEWTADGSFSGEASITGKIEMKMDVTGIPGQEDVHESETIDLAEESDGPHDFEEDISLSFESGASTATTLPDGSTTPVIPVSNVDLMDIFSDAFEADQYEEVEIMHFSVEDGNNGDREHGCFFLIRAGRGVDIDPYTHSFFVAEKGYSPKKLDLNLRQYEDSPPYGPDLGSGDMNGTYDWTEYGKWWNNGEYIGFDMPMENMGIDIADGNVYEVMIKNPHGEVIFKDTFIYSQQYPYRSRSDDDYYTVYIGPFTDEYGDVISGIDISFILDDITYMSRTLSDGRARFELPVKKIPDGTKITAEKDYTEITWNWGIDNAPFQGMFVGDDYYYDDDYYEEESILSFLPFLEDLEDMNPEDFELKHYFAPELGVFVKSEMGMNEIALQNIDDPDAKKALSSLNMEMKPATEKEVESFKSSRSKDYFVKADDGPGTNWVLVGLGVLAAVVVLVFVLMIVMRRKGKQTRSPPSSDHRQGSDPYQRPPPPQDHAMDSRRRRFPPPPDDY